MKLKRTLYELMMGSKAYLHKKPKKENVLKKYAKETGGAFKGASGSDLAELQKRFGKKPLKRKK